MSATILPFARPQAVAVSAPGPADTTDPDTESPAPPVTPFPPRGAPTSRQIAHRWAMLSHLSRHYPRPPDTVR